MKQLSTFLLSIFLISCNPGEKTQNRSMTVPDKEKYAADLIETDFFKYSDNSKVDNLKAKLKKSFDIYDDEIFRIAHIDAEALSEFNFNFFLPNLNKILIRRDIKLSAQKLNYNEASHDALINGDTVTLYTEEELNKGTFWDTAPRNFFRKLNEILMTTRSNESFYLLYGGNDLHAMLLTEEQSSIIADYYKGESKEIPYKP